MKYPSSIIWLQRILGKSTGQIFIHRTQCSYYPDNEHGLDAQAVAALVFAKILENMLLVTGENALLFNCAEVYCRRVQHTKSCILLTITHNIPNYDRNSIIYLRTLAAIHVQAHEWPSNTTGHYLLICRKCSRGVRWQNSIKFIFQKTQYSCMGQRGASNARGRNPGTSISIWERSSKQGIHDIGWQTLFISNQS